MKSDSLLISFAALCILNIGRCSDVNSTQIDVIEVGGSDYADWWIEFYETANEIAVFSTTVIVVLGCFFGNLMTFLTIQTMKRMRTLEISSVSVFLTALALADFNSAFWDGFMNITLPNYFNFEVSSCYEVHKFPPRLCLKKNQHPVAN